MAVRDQRRFDDADWSRQGAAQAANADRRELRWLWRLFVAGSTIDDGLGVDQVTHALQVAHHAARAGWSGDLLAAALLHDVAKPLTLTNHPAAAAEILKPRLGRLAYDLIRCHGLFLGRTLGRTTDPVAGVPDDPPFVAAMGQLVGWDAAAVDPDGPRMAACEAYRVVADLYLS